MIGIQWIGWDDSHWDLNTGQVHLTTGGIEGLGMLDFEEFLETTALLDGQRFTGWRANPRSVLLPVLIGKAATIDEYLRIDKAWWRTMRPDKPGQLIVTQPDGTRRTLFCRFKNDGGIQYKEDPTNRRMSVAVIELTADDPWWVGEPFTQSFSAGTTPENFFGGATGSGPPFFIGSANTLGAAEVINPGDIDAWPEHYIEGPVTEFSITVRGKTIAATMPLLAGQQLRIETDPTRQVATLVTGGQMNGYRRVGGEETNVTRLLESVEFSRIPAGETAELNVTVAGPGTFTLAGEPRFFKAW